MPTAAGSHLAYLTMWATEWHGSTREWAADMGDILLEVIATDVEDASPWLGIGTPPRIAWPPWACC